MVYGSAPRVIRRLSPLKLVLISAAVSLVCLIAYIIGVAVSGNVHTVIAGEIYRAGQPRPGLLDRMERQHGIRTVLNLRGHNPGSPWYDDEVAESRRLGIQHINFRMSSKEELTPQEVRTLIAIMRDAPKPLLIHCAGGSDRTGLASAFYVAAVSKGGESAAEDQLSLRFGHIALPNLDAYAMNRTFERMEPELGYPNS